MQKFRIASIVGFFILGGLFLDISLNRFDDGVQITARALAAEKNFGAHVNRHDVCRYVLGHFDNHNLPLRVIKQGVFDLNNDGRSEIVEKDLKTESGEVLEIKHRDPAAYESLRWFYGTAWLPYDGRFYLVYLDDVGGVFVKAITLVGPDNKQKIICLFESKVTERLYATSRDQEYWDICRAAQAGQGIEVVSFKEPSPVTTNDLNRNSPGGAHIPKLIHHLDFDNDGEEERIVQISVSSSAGGGCDLLYYDLLEPDGTGVRYGAKRDLLMSLQGVDPEDAYPHRRCEGLSRWIRYRDQVLFETKYKGPQPRRTRDLYHDIASVREDEATEICYARFRVQPQ